MEVNELRPPETSRSRHWGWWMISQTSWRWIKTRKWPWWKMWWPQVTMSDSINTGGWKRNQELKEKQKMTWGYCGAVTSKLREMCFIEGHKHPMRHCSVYFLSRMQRVPSLQEKRGVSWPPATDIGGVWTTSSWRSNWSSWSARNSNVYTQSTADTTICQPVWEIIYWLCD